MKYLLLINLDKFAPKERGLLAEKIGGHVPLGLNSDEYVRFKVISFALVGANELSDYGIACSALR